MEADDQPTLIARMPRHRALRRSPLRADRAPSQPGGRQRSQHGPTPDPFGGPKPVDAQAAAAIAEGMRAVAEVAELALTATALLLREIESKLPRGESTRKD